MKKFTISFLTLFFIVSLQAQVKEFKFGDVSIEDLEMTAYPLDSGAEAVYLLDQGEAVFTEYNMGMKSTIHVRLKILKESGLSRADITLRYAKGNAPSKISAATHNIENGKKVTKKVGRKEWVDEKVSDNTRSKTLSFPDVKVGSIIEYTYEQTTGNLGNLPGWSFQSSIPVRYSEYWLQIPHYGVYQPSIQGYHPATKQDITKKYYHIIMEDVPSLKKEPYISTLENYRSRIGFEIKAVRAPNYSETFMENWEAINKELWESETLGEVINDTKQLKKIYPTDKNWTNNTESLIDIYNYVRDHFEWNERYAYAVVDRSKKLWEEGEGDNADINVTLAQFLKQAGIQVYPVVLSTRRHGYLKKFVPLVKQFNYMVVCAIIDDKKVLLDATEKFRPYNVLPARAMNGEGLMVTEAGPVWIDLRENGEMDSKTVSGEFGFNEDLDGLEGKMQIDFNGMAASSLRSSIFEEREKVENDVEEEEETTDDEEEEGLDDYKTGEVENLEVINVDEIDKTLKVQYDFKTEGDINAMGDKIFLSPVLMKYVDENPFKLENRLFPVEIPAPIADTYIFKIKIPEGYEVEELPKSQNMVLPNAGGKYMFIAGQQDDTIQIMIRLSLSKTQYTPESYPALKELFNQVVAKQQEQIVLKEKTNE
ncbi:DUF3857 domain-containing protein [Roseivirga sp. E12]|uniref:DUF3857 domain-containing protein n=1 Tax=Roseivirga sp. E12 TaxID=2819237 RepID=UPI001ABD16EC|nr:DUF3857 domain-containing protein [Roseivirga sp. E12]MBO3699709.1 DUF3857 domain-containing protein [Roseivirga sp. E12]